MFVCVYTCSVGFCCAQCDCSECVRSDQCVCGAVDEDTLHAQSPRLFHRSVHRDAVLHCRLPAAAGGPVYTLCVNLSLSPSHTHVHTQTNSVFKGNTGLHPSPVLYHLGKTNEHLIFIFWKSVYYIDQK